MRVLLVGRFGRGALELSYEAGMRAAGAEIERFDIEASVRKNCRLGTIGQSFNRFVPVEPWILKANREMVLAASRFQPDVIAVLGQNPVRAGALAQIRSMGRSRTVLIWPDTLIVLNSFIVSALPLYDLVATYSRSTLLAFERLGASRPAWIPLGCDPFMHGDGQMSMDDDVRYRADVCFIGQWRPERERAMFAILSGKKKVDLKIWGPDWGRRCRGNGPVLRAWQKRSLYEGEFAKAVKASKINLNVIDDTNFPAANMRFFEIPCSGGFQLCSDCPEMSEEFVHGQTLCYYKNSSDLPNLVECLLEQEDELQRMATTARNLVLERHTYADRARQILSMLCE